MVNAITDDTVEPKWDFVRRSWFNQNFTFIHLNAHFGMMILEERVTELDYLNMHYV